MTVTHYFKTSHSVCQFEFLVLNLLKTIWFCYNMHNFLYTPARVCSVLVFNGLRFCISLGGGGGGYESIWHLKFLFNIVEASFKRIVELWCLCWIMMFRWTNKQPGIQTFWNLWGNYQDIYDWISLLNKWTASPFILTQQFMGRNEWDKSGLLSIFTSLKHLTLNMPKSQMHHIIHIKSIEL